MGGLQLEVVRTEDGVADLVAAWAELFDRSDQATPYLHPGWAQPWRARFAPASTAHVVTVREGGRLVALAPWLEVRAGVGPTSGRLLVGMGQETADFGGVLLGEEPARTGPVLVDHLRTELADRRTVYDATRLAPDDPWLAALQGCAATGELALRPVFTETFPRLDLSVDDPPRTVRRLLKANDVRRRWRRLDEVGPATFTYHRPDRVAEDLATFCELHDLRWQAKEGTPAVPFTPACRPFLDDAAVALDRAGLLRLSVIRSAGRPVAARFGFEHQGTYFGVQSAWDPAFASYGPGHLLVGKILEHGALAGLRAFDFMRGATAHKTTWTKDGREVSYWTLAPADRLAWVRDRLLWAALARRARRRARRGAM